MNCKPKSEKETRFLEMQFLSILTSRNFAWLTILTSEVDPENFRSVSQKLAQRGLIGAL